MVNKNLETAPVALVFFNRPHALSKVFAEVKKAKPTILFLIQDGPRKDNNDDIIKVAECRKIVEQVDWDCDVRRNYSAENLGCGRRPFTGISWVFSKVDRAIILEDDCVPSQSFFPFCSELLERYLHDERVFLISGMNMELKTATCKESYFFGYSGTNWGWASWRRCWEKVDYNMDFVNDLYTIRLLKEKLKMISGKKGLNEIKIFIETNERLNRGENISYWDVQWQTVRYMHSQLSIIPAKNMITNIGIGEGATHSKIIDKRKPNKGKINFFFNDRYEIDFPLAHPRYLLQNIDYDKKVDARIYPNILIRAIRKAINIKKKLWLTMVRSSPKFLHKKVSGPN
jgi:hypothetical protein